MLRRRPQTSVKYLARYILDGLEVEVKDKGHVIAIQDTDYDAFGTMSALFRYVTRDFHPRVIEPEQEPDEQRLRPDTYIVNGEQRLCWEGLAHDFQYNRRTLVKKAMRFFYDQHLDDTPLVHDTQTVLAV